MAESISELEYTRLGRCICCGKDFGYKFALVGNRLLFGEFGCFGDVHQTPCIHSGKADCLDNECYQIKTISNLKQDHIQKLYQTILNYLKEDYQILWNLDYQYEISKTVFNRLIELNQKGYVYAQIDPQALKSKRIFLQLWKYTDIPKKDSSFFIYPKLSDKCKVDF